MMNKNNWLNKFFPGNKGPPGKERGPLRSKGSEKDQENVRKRPTDGQQRNPPNEKKMSGLLVDDFMKSANKCT